MPAFYLGIDVSKGYADCVIVDANERIVEDTFQLDDTFTGHRRLYQVLTRFVETHGPDVELFAAVESTGGYENNWLGALRRFQAKLPLQATRLNPARVLNHAKAEGCRTTTDATSAYFIATYLRAHASRVRYDVHEDLAPLRAQWTFIQQLKKQRTALVNQLESVLYRVQPELLRHLSRGTPAWFLKLLKRYPTAKRLARARPTTLAKIPYLTQERAQALVASAKQSVASDADAVTEALVEALARQVLHLTKLLKKQTKRLTEALELPEEIALLKSFGPIGTYSAIGILLEIETIERFASAKKMASFFGVHPVFKQSGDGIGAMRMSKQGASEMRALLYMITLRAIKDHPIIAPLYARLVEEEGKEKMVAIGACMHKTLRILYGMLKHHRRFDPEIDRHNRQRRHRRRPGSRPDRKRRYQGYDPQAPISDRAKKRRRSQAGSHGGVSTACGMSSATTASSCQRGEQPTSSVKEQAVPT